MPMCDIEVIMEALQPLETPKLLASPLSLHICISPYVGEPYRVAALVCNDTRCPCNGSVEAVLLAEPDWNDPAHFTIEDLQDVIRDHVGKYCATEAI